MNDLVYLKEIRLSNFRSFGADARIALPPGPGFTVVTGPNGLGKTSLIEGVEWALTGKVRRLLAGEPKPEKVAAALTRRGTPAASHRVELVFGNETVIVRGPNEAPTLGSVLAVLQSTGWKQEIADVGAYMAMTHILSQSAMLRLTARPADERWKDLSQTAGMDRIDRISRNLGKSTKDRIQRRTTELAGEQNRIEERLIEFRARRQRLAQLEAAMGNRDMLPPGIVLDSTRRHLETMDALLGIATTVPADASAALSALLTGIAGARQTIAERRRYLEFAYAAFEEFTAAGTELSTVGSDLGEALAARDHAKNVLADAVTAAQVADALRNDARGALNQATDHRIRLYARRDALGHYRQAVEMHNSAAAEIVGLQEALDAAREQEIRLRTALDELNQNGESARELRNEVAALQGLATAERLVREQQIAAAEASAKIEAQEPVIEGLNATAQRLRAEVEDAERLADAAERSRAQVAADFEERARLAADLAAHLHDEDTVCPVCESEFAFGKLLERARTLAKRQDPRLAEATQEARRVAMLLSERIAAAAEAESERTAAIRRVTDLHRVVIEAEEMTLHLLSERAVGGRPLEGLADWLAGRITECRNQLEELTAASQRLDPEGLLGHRAALAATVLQQAERKLKNANATANALERDLADRQARLDADGDLADLDARAVDVAIDAVLVKCAEAERRADTSAAAVASAVDTLDRVRTAAQAAANTVASLEQRRIAAQERRERALAVWREIGLPEKPAANFIKTYTDQIGRIEDMLVTLSEQHREMAKGYGQWLENASLQALRAEVLDVVQAEGATDAEDCEARMSARAAALEAQQKRWQEARSLVGVIEQRIRDDQSDYVEEILQPLQERVRAFDLAWSSFPDLQLDLSFRLSAYNKRQSLDFQIGQHDAGLILSEGQSGVKNLSYLLSASTAYRWSRWRALLLDDPLQHNDLVHKTAFLDVLRSLVKHERYQVVMSTHDLDEARFIGRKCRNAGVAFRLCRLLAPGDTGVEFELI